MLVEKHTITLYHVLSKQESESLENVPNFGITESINE